MSLSRRSNDSAKEAGVRVYNMKIFSQLIRDAPEEARTLKTAAPKPKTAEEARREIREEEFAKLQIRQQQQVEEQLKLAQMRAQQREDAQFQANMTKINDGKTLTDSIDKFLTVTEASELMKKEQLYVDWETDVFATVQHSVNQSMEGVDRKALTKKRNEDFQKFLAASNNPSGVFLDTVFEGDTEPAKAHSLKAKPRINKDPVRKSINKHRREVALNSPTGVSAKPKEREILDPRQWNDGKIQATPYGHFAHFVGKEHNPTEMQKKMTKSDVQFDNYNFPRDGVKVAGGKRVYSDKGNFHAPLYPRDGPWNEK